MRVSNYILFYPNIFSTKENGQTKEYLYSFAMNKKSYLERILIEIQDKDFIEKYYPTVWRFFRKPKARPFISKARCHTFAPAR